MIFKICFYRSFDSVILTGSTQGDQLKSLIGFDQKLFSLLYRGTRDGKRSFDFHRKVDGVNKTLTIIKSSNGFIFGGYTETFWYSRANYVYDTQAFIFTLTNPYNTPLKHNIKRSCQNVAFYDQWNYGPTFGNHDIHVQNNFGTGSFIQTNCYDPCPNNIPRGAYYNNYDSQFTPVEIEVFAVKSINP